MGTGRVIEKPLHLDGPEGGDVPFFDPALIERSSREMHGSPALAFRVAFEGGVQLQLDVRGEDEALRLRMYVRDHADDVVAAIVDLLETWCAR